MYLELQFTKREIARQGRTVVRPVVLQLQGKAGDKALEAWNKLCESCLDYESPRLPPRTFHFARDMGHKYHLCGDCDSMRYTQLPHQEVTGTMCLDRSTGFTSVLLDSADGSEAVRAVQPVLSRPNDARLLLKLTLVLQDYFLRHTAEVKRGGSER